MFQQADHFRKRPPGNDSIRRVRPQTRNQINSGEKTIVKKSRKKKGKPTFVSTGKWFLSTHHRPSIARPSPRHWTGRHPGHGPGIGWPWAGYRGSMDRGSGGHRPGNISDWFPFMALETNFDYRFGKLEPLAAEINVRTNLRHDDFTSRPSSLLTPPPLPTHLAEFLLTGSENCSNSQIINRKWHFNFFLIIK